MKLTNKCPHCQNHTLEFCNDAIVKFDLLGGKLIPLLDEISYLDNSFLHCSECGLDNEDSKDLNELHKEFLKAI